MRMERHVANARRVVEFLSTHAAVESISYPEFVSHPDYELAKTLLPKRLRLGVLIQPQRRPRRRPTFCRIAQNFPHLANAGDAKF